ncbi:MAG TPA: opioid growth factor receptor-related protein [Acidobacteriaceae bacterium]|nr:opioid growth factor receptor-related protein [Acidobacteriaceae bacterium]
MAANEPERRNSSLTPSPANRLVAFYRDGAPDDEGRTLAEILAWDDDRLEAIHDFIQWLFPLPEPSGANPLAPILDPATIRIFQSSIAMQDRLRQSFQRMMRFYGFRQVTTPAGIAIERAADFSARAQNWLWPMNHNHLRLTRILRSTLLLGLAAESKALFHALNALYREYPDRIPSRTHAFWSSAAGS